MKSQEEFQYFLSVIPVLSSVIPGSHFRHSWPLSSVIPGLTGNILRLVLETGSVCDASSWSGITFNTGLDTFISCVLSAEYTFSADFRPITPLTMHYDACRTVPA